MNLIFMKEIRSLYAERCGGNFFDKETIKHFCSRFCEYGYKAEDNIYFVSSERQEGQQRLYSIRKMDITGNINSVGKTGKYKNSESAKLAIMKLLREGA